MRLTFDFGVETEILKDPLPFVPTFLVPRISLREISVCGMTKPWYTAHEITIIRLNLAEQDIHDHLKRTE